MFFWSDLSLSRLTKVVRPMSKSLYLSGSRWAPRTKFISASIRHVLHIEQRIFCLMHSASILSESSLKASVCEYPGSFVMQIFTSLASASSIVLLMCIGLASIDL